MILIWGFIHYLFLCIIYHKSLICSTLLCCHFVWYLQSPDSCPTWGFHEGSNHNPGKTSRPLMTHFLQHQQINFNLNLSFFIHVPNISTAFDCWYSPTVVHSFFSDDFNCDQPSTKFQPSLKTNFKPHQADIFLLGFFSSSSSSSGLRRISLKKWKYFLQSSSQRKRLEAAAVRSPEMLCLEIKLPRLLPIIASSVQDHALLDQQRVVIGCPEQNNDNPDGHRLQIFRIFYFLHPNIWSVAARRRLFGVQMWELIHAWVKENIARGTTDPGYWLFNLSYLSS